MMLLKTFQLKYIKIFTNENMHKNYYYKYNKKF